MTLLDLAVGPWDQVVGQADVVEQLKEASGSPVHAWMFVGPEGSGKRETAQVFAAAILSNNFTQTDYPKILKQVMLEQHLDVSVVEPEGRAMLIADAKRITEAASTPPVRGAYKIVIADGFHSASPEVAPSLLKTIEEPPEGVIIIILSEYMPHYHETIASRCAKIEFLRLSSADIKDWITSSCDIENERAEEISKASLGNLKRARMLIDDPEFSDRVEFWRQVPTRCGVSGYEASRVAHEILELIKKAQAPLFSMHKKELEQQTDEMKQFSLSETSKTALESRHRREIRQFREQEIRWGFSVLADSYWQKFDVIQNGMEGRNADDTILVSLSDTLSRLRTLQSEMKRNPNETLMLQNLFINLPSIV